MRIALSFIALVGITGCPGHAPPNEENRADAAPEVDADTTPTGLMLSGKAMDYFGNVALDGAALATDGLDPAVMATSATDGAYMIQVAVGSRLFLLGTKTAYRPTRSAAIAVSDMPVTQDAYLMSVQDVTNQYTGIGAVAVAGTAFVVADLRKNDNTPVEGPLTDIQLLDSNNVVVTGVKGPYAFNAAGNVDMVATSVTAYSGRSRVAYFDVPPGSYTLQSKYPMGGAAVATINTQLSTAADGATLVLSGGTGPMGGSSVTDPSFTTDIYPKLQRAALGGLGCANCHTLSGPAAVLKYDDPAATVLTNIKAATGVIDLVTPANSLLLVRPLYEKPPATQDHPNATFIDVNDADYKLFLLWITNGAKP